MIPPVRAAPEALEQPWQRINASDVLVTLVLLAFQRFFK